MALSIMRLCLAAILHSTSGSAHSLPVLEARGPGSKGSGVSGSDALVLDDYSAEGGDGIQLTRTNIIIISVVSAISFVLTIGSIFLCWWARLRRKGMAARTSLSGDTQYSPNSSNPGTSNAGAIPPFTQRKNDAFYLDFYIF